MAASSAENRMNLAALQQCDPYIDGIVQTAIQVALYTFNGSANEWEKTDIEGSLFVYSRSATPMNGFMIMNRLSMNNWTEPITKDLEFQHQHPFLLYRNAKSIFGLWFYDKGECAKVTKVMNGLVHKVQQKAKASVRQRSVSESSPRRQPKAGKDQQSKPVDIMQMLTKAQDEYNQSNKPEQSHVTTASATIVRPIPVKAKDKGQKGQRSKDDRGPSEMKGHSTQHQGSKFQRSVSMQEKPSDIPPALQKLLQSGVPQRNIDHPLTKGEVVTVESLEDVHTKKSEKGESQKEGQFRTVESIESVHRTGGSSQEQSVPIQNLLAQLQKQQPSNRGAGSQDPIHHVASDSSLLSLSSHNQSKQVSKHKLPVSESNPDLTQTLLANLSSTPGKSSGLLLPHHLTQGSPSSSAGGSSPGGGGQHKVPSLQQIASDGMQTLTSSNTAESIESVFQTSPQRIPASIAPPTLLTPQVFRQRATSDIGTSKDSLGASKDPLLPSFTPVLTTSSMPQSCGDVGTTDKRKALPSRMGQLAAGHMPQRIDPLTKEQFQEAFVQLLRTDDDFTSKLYGAYLSTQQQKK